MKSRVFASCLCFLMAASLLAQETAQVAPTNPVLDGNRPAEPAAAAAPPLLTLPRGTEVEMVLLEPVSSATAVAGQPVRFAVTKEVTADGLVVIPKGALVNGVVKEVKKGVPGERDGYVLLEPKKVALANGSWMKLRDDPSGEDACGDMGPCWALAGFAVLISPLIVAALVVNGPRMIENANKRKKPVVAGTDQTMEVCWHNAAYTGKALNLPLAGTQTAPPAALDELTNLGGCPAARRLRAAQ